MKKRIFKTLSLVLVIAMVVSLMSTAFAAYVTDFKDVKSTDWYYAAVDYAASNGLFSGTSATTFSPNAAMTRGMFVTVLGRLAGVPDSYGRTQGTPFSDVIQLDYFYPYAVWVNDNGIVTDVGGNAFAPNLEITREQMAAMLYRYAEKACYDITYADAQYNTFADAAKVSSYAVTAMKWATTQGIINGTDGKLVPQDKASRAQVAQIFLNFSRVNHPGPPMPDEPDKPNPGDEPDWEHYNPTYDIPTGRSATDADGGYYDYDLANKIMAQINTLRASYGADALLYNPKIAGWAAIRAIEQTQREGHTRPDGSIFGSVGIGLTAENITIMFGCTETQLSNTVELAKRAVNNWFTSTAGHKEAMLSSAPNLGVVACYARGSTVYVVHLFSNKTLYFMDYLI